MRAACCARSSGTRQRPARPPLIPYNPALRPRNRGRKTGRRLERDPQKIWATPLETLLVAERAALLSGTSDDFTLILTLGYTGLRWGEAIGLEYGYLRPALINVEWQLREIGGVFHRLPPKDGSYRSEQWEPGDQTTPAGRPARKVISQIPPNKEEDPIRQVR
jgi:integrase